MSYLFGAACESVEIKIARTIEEVNQLLGGNLNLRGYTTYLIEKYRIVPEFKTKILVDNVMAAREYILKRNDIRINLENYRKLKEGQNIEILIEMIEIDNGLKAA